MFMLPASVRELEFANEPFALHKIYLLDIHRGAPMAARVRIDTEQRNCMGRFFVFLRSWNYFILHGHEKMIHLSQEELHRIRVSQAIKAEGKANKETWKSCLWCWQVAGNYTKDAVKGLAEDLGKSDDTVYDRAHAYEMFNDICQYKDGKYRLFAFYARRAPYITWSHFRALWDIRKDYKMSMPKIISLLSDVLQGEGELSSRKLDEHARGRYGVERTWEYYVQKSISSLRKLLDDPNLPRDVRLDVQDFYKKMEKRGISKNN